MKTLIVLLISLITVNSNAATILGGSYDKQSDSIILDVVYQGGCKDHEFVIRLNMCNRAMPMSCSAQLFDKTEGDFCRALMQKTITIPASQVVDQVNISEMKVFSSDDSSALIKF